MQENKINIAIFASGGGTNAENFFKYFKNNNKIKVSLLVCNNPKAAVIQKATDAEIPIELVSREQLRNPKEIIRVLTNYHIDYIILAGFLWLIPEVLVNAYPGKIINIHPALLPKYGGKGMYGMNVHEAVKQAKEEFTGITIHTIDNEYDRGKIIFQQKVAINTIDESPEQIAEKVHELEMKYYPEVVEKFIVDC